jgi:hypothetical protein
MLTPGLWFALAWSITQLVQTLLGPYTHPNLQGSQNSTGPAQTSRTPASPPKSKGKELDTVCEVVRRAALREHLQSGHTLPDGDIQLVSVDDPREETPMALAQGGAVRR